MPHCEAKRSRRAKRDPSGGGIASKYIQVYYFNINIIAHNYKLWINLVDSNKPPSVLRVWKCSSFDYAFLWNLHQLGLMRFNESLENVKGLTHIPCRMLRHYHAIPRPCRFWMVAFHFWNSLRSSSSPQLALIKWADFPHKLLHLRDELAAYLCFL